MSYKDRLSPGSFRGVPFLTPAHEMTSGHRGTVHERPGSNDHTTQPMGLMPRRFSVTAWVMGPDYDLDRDALIAALEKPGTGRLVHYFYGALDVEVEPGKEFSVSESQDRGGMAVFTIPFILAKRPTLPILAASRYDRVKVKTGNAILESMRAFADKLNTSGIEEVRAEVVTTLQGATAIVGDVNAQINTLLATPTQVAGMITALGDQLAQLVATPSRFGELAAGLNAISEALFGAIADIGRALFDSTRTVDGDGLAAAQAQTDARRLVRALRIALRQTQAIDDGDSPNEQIATALVKQTAALHAALAAVEMPFDNQANAEEVRDEFGAALAALAAAADDTMYAALTDARVELMAHLTGIAGGLARTVDFTPAVSLPAVLIAHMVHGDARRCEEIIARNNIRHPCFVTGGYPIKVLADG